MTDQRKLSPGAQFVSDLLTAYSKAMVAGLDSKRAAVIANDFAEDIHDLSSDEGWKPNKPIDVSSDHGI